MPTAFVKNRQKPLGWARGFRRLFNRTWRWLWLQFLVCAHLCTELPTCQILWIDSLLSLSDWNRFDSVNWAAASNAATQYLWTLLQNPPLMHWTAFPTPQNNKNFSKKSVLSAEYLCLHQQSTFLTGMCSCRVITRRLNLDFPDFPVLTISSSNSTYIQVCCSRHKATPSYRLIPFKCWIKPCLVTRIK